LAKGLKIQTPGVKASSTDRSASSSKKDLNSSGLLDKSTRSDRSQSPASKIGARLFKQGEEKKDLNSSGLTDKPNRSDRSQSPASNIGTRLFKQAEELKLKKERLRLAYEAENSIGPSRGSTTLSTTASRKKLSATVVSTLKSPRAGASATISDAKAASAGHQPQSIEVKQQLPDPPRPPIEAKAQPTEPRLQPPQTKQIDPPDQHQPPVKLAAPSQRQPSEVESNHSPSEGSDSEFGFDSDPDVDELEAAIATLKTSHRTTEESNESYLAEEEKSYRSSTQSYQDQDIEQSIQHKLEKALKMMETQGGEEEIVINKIKHTMGKYS
jgi:hypothetical protein